jgi:hypothetical protein
VASTEAKEILTPPATWTEPKHRPKSRRELRTQIGRINDTNRVEAFRQRFDAVSEAVRVQVAEEELRRRAEGLGEEERAALLAKGIETRKEAFERGAALIERTVAEERALQVRMAGLEVSERHREHSSQGGYAGAETKRQDNADRDRLIHDLRARGRTTAEIAANPKVKNPRGESLSQSQINRILRKPPP